MSEKLYKKPSGMHTRWSSFENPQGRKGEAAKENFGAKGHAFDKVQAGKTVNLLDYSEGAGIVNRIWITINDRSPFMLRSLVLRCYWDGAIRPAVECPLGDFFSLGTEMTAFENELFSSPEGRSFNMYIPMPFKKSAIITLTNESDLDLTHLFYDINFTAADVPDENALYFHTYWKRDLAINPGEDYVFLDVKGKGRVVGTSFEFNTNPSYGKTWFGEGEVKAYIDGDKDFPTLCGTGTEDYIGSGWGQGRYHNRYQGCLMADSEKRKFIFYRLHIKDPIYFDENIKYQIQIIGGASVAEIREFEAKGVAHIPVSGDDPGGIGFTPLYKLNRPLPEKGWVNYYRSDDVASATWFYLDKNENDLPPIAPQPERIK